MFSPTNLCKSRHGIYYFRFRLPSRNALQQPCYIKMSLGTREPHEALQLARMLEYHAVRVLTDPRAAFMTNDEIKGLVRRFCEQVLQKRKNEIQQTGPLSDAAVLGLHKALEDHYTAQTLQEGGVRIDDSQTMAVIMGSMALSFTPDSPEYKMLQTNYALAYPKAIQEILRYNSAQQDFDFADAVPTSTIILKAQEHLSLRELVDKYMSMTSKDRGWTAVTVLERQALYDTLCEILGENYNALEINAKDARQVRDTLLVLPSNRNKKASLRNLTLEQAIASDAAKIAARTVNKYLDAFNALFAWAENEAYISKNYFSGLHGKSEDKDKRPPRLPFSEKQIAEMKAVLADKDHDLIKRKPYRYWGLLLAMYTGARLNEIAQIQLDDIMQDNGIWFINMHDDGDDMRLKNEASRRRVPIHQTLLDLGLIEYRDSLKAQQKTRLLHEMTHCVKNGWGKKLGQFVNENFLVKLGMKTPQHVFHSFRHTTVTRLMQASIEYPIILSLVGHELSGTAAQTYFNEGYTLPKLKAAIDQLHPDFPT